MSSLWSQGDRGERSDDRVRLDAAGQEGDFARVCLQSDGEMENDDDWNINYLIIITTSTTIVKIIDHEISDHILAPVRGLQCCDPHPANKWHWAKDKVFSCLDSPSMSWWGLYVCFWERFPLCNFKIVHKDPDQVLHWDGIFLCSLDVEIYRLHTRTWKI